MSQLLLTKKVMPLNGKINNLDNFLFLNSIWNIFLFRYLAYFWPWNKIGTCFGKNNTHFDIPNLWCFQNNSAFNPMVHHTEEWRYFYSLIVCHVSSLVWITVKASKFYIKHCHCFSCESTQFKKMIKVWIFSCYWWKQPKKLKNQLLYKFSYEMTCAIR